MSKQHTTTNEEHELPITGLLVLALSGAISKAKRKLAENKDTIIKVGAFAGGAAIGAVAVALTKR